MAIRTPKPERVLVEGREAERDDAYLLEVIDRCLDNGIVIEGRTSRGVLGIEVLALDFRSLVTSFDRYDQYLEYAEAIERTAD